MIEQLTASRFSTITRLSRKALRLYDERGILVPLRDPVNNYRYYRLAQVEDGLKIKMLADMGFSLDELIEIISILHEGKSKELTPIFEEKRCQISAEIARLQKLEEIIRSNDPIKVLYMSCSEAKIKHLPRFRVLSRRERGTYSETIGKLIGELMGELFSPENRDSVTMTGPLMFIAHDKEFKETDADIEVAVPITGRINITPKFEVRNIPECDVVSLVYTGAYRDIGPAYSKVMNYAMENEMELSERPVNSISMNQIRLRKTF